ncbi:double zinc ribbon domain-containing protein [Frigidibacter sp. ROC022]|uniref:double zinc ribbon domain-containing protein n=1 Tax=Frigidibacter sp. ROC022 TaxID=2971796 RepID=UPI00215A53F9|nr:double zinc ribbon domain-containing protein [Frigidibacter sp. ROC022]MCR8724440.1 double zinc ribbon domain-containing protein [Frigidibacter sp. ROC022]
MAGRVMQSVVGLLYPAQCVSCDARIDGDHALCGPCWRETPFITGLVCDLCGVPLPGEDLGTIEHCDDCLAIARPWSRGRAAMLYRDNGRRLVLALKHGDRPDLARPAARWMAAAAAPLMQPGTLVVPVPVHWSRLLKRRYSQSALLARELARITGHDWLPDGLLRARKTPMLDGLNRDQRFATLDEAVRPHPKRGVRLSGRPVLVVDDVMTSGATLSTTADAARAAGATSVRVMALARVAKDT